MPYGTGMLKSHLSLVALAGSVGFFLVVGWLSLSTWDFGAYHDDGIYAVTGRSLAVSGEYRITSLPGEPFQRKYPIVFPAMLAAVWRIAGDFPANIVWLKAVSLLAGAVFLSLTFGLLRIVGASAWTGAVIAGVCAVLPATGELANREKPWASFNRKALANSRRSGTTTRKKGRYTGPER